MNRRLASSGRNAADAVGGLHCSVFPSLFLLYLSGSFDVFFVHLHGIWIWLEMVFLTQPVCFTFPTAADSLPHALPQR